MNRQLILCFSFLLILASPISANSEETPKKELSLATRELIIGTVSILVAQDPEGVGRYLLCCAAPIPAILTLWDTSPIQRQKHLMSAGAIVVYGLWNVSMQDDDKSTAAIKNFLLFNTVVLIKHSRRPTDTSETKTHSRAFLAPTKSGATLVYQYRF